MHRGFARRTEKLYRQEKGYFDDNDNFVLGGHSLGGACAVLLASLLNEEGKRVENVYTFGMPRFVSAEFREYYKQSGLDSVSRHYTTPRDPVVYKIPYIFDAIGDYEVVPCDEEDSLSHHDMSSYSKIWN